MKINVLLHKVIVEVNGDDKYKIQGLWVLVDCSFLPFFYQEKGKKRVESGLALYV